MKYKVLFLTSEGGEQDTKPVRRNLSVGGYPCWSPYAYTLCNPLNYFDQDGKFPFPILYFAAEAIFDLGVSIGVSLAATMIVHDAITNNSNGFGARKVNIGSTTTPFPSTEASGMLNLKHPGTFIDNTITNVPADATNVGGNSETLIEQGVKPITSTQAKKTDIKQVDYIAKKYGIDRKGFSKYLHSEKKRTDRKGKSVDKDQLEEWAREYKEFFGQKDMENDNE